jgi:hypothetical protein
MKKHILGRVRVFPNPSSFFCSLLRTHFPPFFFPLCSSSQVSTDFDTEPSLKRSKTLRSSSISTSQLGNEDLSKADDEDSEIILDDENDLYEDEKSNADDEEDDAAISNENFHQDERGWESKVSYQQQTKKTLSISFRFFAKLPQKKKLISFFFLSFFSSVQFIEGI